MTPADVGTDISVVRIDRLELAFEPQAWSFADRRRPEIDSYFAGISEAAAERGFATRRLSDIVAAAATALPPDPTHGLDAEVLARLTKCAAKWYGGPGDASSGARQYLALNLQEKHAVEVAYPGSIFVTFNSSDFRSIFPDRLPIFYMYSIKKGVAVKPWFMDAKAPPPLVLPPRLTPLLGAQPAPASLN